MLYVFRMDVGQMLTFEISLLMDTVGTLQQELSRVTNISVDKQILLISGGHSLKPQQKVISYGAGTDTNPVFLFSKLAIESQEPPLVRSFGVGREVIVALKDRILEATNLPVEFETVAKRTRLACEISEHANKVLAFCSDEFKEQHLQYQGWGTVVANLEEIAQAMQKTESKFKKAFTAFLPQRENNFRLLENFNETVSLLDRIPLLKSLKERETGEVLTKRSQDEGIISFVASTNSGPATLLEWITTQGQGQSIETIQLKCHDDLLLFDSEMFAHLDNDVQEQLSLVMVDPHHMKELVGIERRLSELERRLNEAKSIAQEQKEMAQGFINHQTKLKSTKNSALFLPDLCISHKQQLQQMLDRLQRIETLQNNFKKSKQEMSTNIHQRLGWVMHIETRISKLDSDLIYHLKTLRILECNLQLLNQIKAAPQVYADMVVEAARRRLFSSKFIRWSEALVDDSKQLYISETERRKQFSRKLGEHFLLDTLFKGFEDMPPSFATKCPQPFDTLLPDITVDDIALLKSAVPELEEFLNLSVDAGSVSLNLLSRVLCESPRLQLVMPQSSQTEWSYQSDCHTKPCIIVATEAPPTKFTLPDIQEPLTTEHPPAVSNLTETMKNAMKPSSDSSSAKGSDPSSESSSSVVAFEPGSNVQSVKTQTKTNSTHTDSTSPISSNEFATADFYFEDSMPSPMADSPLDKREEKKVEGAKTHCDSIASLQAELAEKVALIHALELKIKEKEVNLSYSEQLSYQKGSSTDGSSTLLGTADFLDTAVTSDSVDAVSLDFYSAVIETNIDRTVDTMEESSATDLSIDVPVSSIPSEESLRVQNLVLELSLASSDLSKLRESLTKAETKLQELQEQSEKTVCEKEFVIVNLQDQLKNVKEELSEARNIDNSKTEIINNLEKSLGEAKTTCATLEQDVKSGNESLERIKSRLLEFREKLRIDLPFVKQSLAELRSSVLENKADLDRTIASAISSIDKHVSLFNSSILADAYEEYEREKEGLKAEIQQLKLDLNKYQSDASEKVIHLNSMNEELRSRAEKFEKEFARRSEEQKRDFDASLKDIETKHILEMEIELDKVRTDVKESLEEVERLIKLKDDLNQELCVLKKCTEKQKDDLERVHKEEIEELKYSHSKDKEATIALLNRQFKSDLEVREQERLTQVAEFKAKLNLVQERLVSEKQYAITSLSEQLIDQREVAVAELKQTMKENEANLADVLEKKQLDHVHKLTQLKTHFDMERESLVAEITKLTKWDKSHMESQTEHHLLADVLTNSDTQTEIVHMAEIMAHSETQTGMELLAEVISLTSSASYGSEEMIAHKQLSTLTDDKDSRETETTSKLQQTIDDLNVQLASAQETLSAMEGELAALRAGQQNIDGSMFGSQQPDKMSSTESGALSSAGCGASHKDFTQVESVTSSFMVMDKEPSSPEPGAGDTEATRAKDKRIAELEKKLMKMSMTASERETTADKVSIRRCDKGNLVLLCLDERHDQYVVFTVGTILHFLHSESHETLGLKTSGEASSKKSWILAEVVDKEYCLAKKPNNRFRVPQGTCFYRVKCKPWKCEMDAFKQEREASKSQKMAKPDHSSGARPKKLEKKVESFEN